jgi:uncharacterized protein (TIGR03118 family)
MDTRQKIVRSIAVVATAAAMAIGAASCGGGGEVFVAVGGLHNASQFATKFGPDLVDGAATAGPTNLVNPGASRSIRSASPGSPTAAWRTQYDGNGISAAGGDDPAGGARPTGIVFNDTRDFRVGQNGVTAPSQFIFAGEGGTLSGFAAGGNANSAVTVFDGGANGPVYKGLAIARFAGANYLYAADFRNNAIDVFNASFARVRTLPGRFRDPRLPDGYAPFGVLAVRERIYVAYARQADGSPQQVTGAGLGVVNVFDTGGVFISRLVTGGELNAPWGMALAPVNFGTFGNALLVGNFGDGRVNAYNAVTGRFEGVLSRNDGSAIASRHCGASPSATALTFSRPIPCSLRPARPTRRTGSSAASTLNRPCAASVVDALEALAVNAPEAVDAVDVAGQRPAGADFLHRDFGGEFGGKLFGPHTGRALPFEQFLVLEDDGGVEYGHGKQGHGVQSDFIEKAAMVPEKRRR